jgi:hypothetical protein
MIRLSNRRPGCRSYATSPSQYKEESSLITLDPSSSTELWDGDAIHLVGGVTVVFVTKEYPNTIATEYFMSLSGSLGIHFAAEAPQLVRWTRNPVGISVSSLF